MELVDLADAVHGVDFRVFAEPIAAGGRVRGIVAPGCGGMSRRELDELTDLARRHGAGGPRPPGGRGRWRRCPARPPSSCGESAGGIRRRSAQPAGDLILIVADADPIRGAEALGHVRLEMGERLGLRTPGVLAYVWIRHFPMFKWDADGKRWDATHNPFSAPVWEEEDRLESRSGLDPRPAVRPGPQRLGVGRRLHPDPSPRPAGARLRADGPLDGERPRPVRALLDALEYGAPPHGGIAIGLDRWAALFAEVDNIREVMAFPKTQSGADLMLGAPSPIAEAQLDELGLRIVERD